MSPKLQAPCLRSNRAWVETVCPPGCTAHLHLTINTKTDNNLCRNKGEIREGRHADTCSTVNKMSVDSREELVTGLMVASATVYMT